ncbi:DUF5347 domain-containing protein [Erwinia psidii]|uniref:DUF5347 domain-containing protein n=1 Tax=Erwinia psidii TaxID=69224 RepID=A0A3N6SDZ4_9GAMM|nr:DUF5347 domain-containing protein [Erwinia psidii]MCX8962731.1 hypothetical protein [Erwinia psidii]RQM36831.1 hypothetical protein EB241_17830 [Erwinia psidii]
MAIEAESALVAITTGKRAAGLNHVAELRTRLFGDNSEKDISRFMDDMRDVRDSNYQENKRALSAIFYLANIKTDRHELDFNDLTTDERNSLIRAMNHFRAVVSLFPKRLTLPN